MLALTVGECFLNSQVICCRVYCLQLHALGVPAGHFSHIMFDEAGHAEEPLALCALAGVVPGSTVEAHIDSGCSMIDDLVIGVVLVLLLLLSEQASH